MAFVPNTTVRLLRNIPLDKEYANNITFQTVSEQTTYFNGNAKYSFTDFTYQRRTNDLMVPIIYDNIYDCNYIMFQNSNFGNKWFYAFITEMEYANENTTRIKFEIDVFQTWKFDYTIKSAYVEREHVNDDRPGFNILDEGIGYGEYVTYSRVDNEDTGISDCNYVVASTRSITDPSVVDTSGGQYDGVFNGVKYYAYSTASDLKKALANFAEYTDSITSIFMAPKMLSPFEGGSHLVNESGAYNRGSFYGVRPINFQGYVPKNNKLFTYPYCVMNVVNNNGGAMALKYEYFNDPNQCEIIIEGVLNKGICLICFPTNYKGVTDNREYSLTLPPYATCEWVNDVYSTWLTQNSASTGLGLVGSAITTGVGVATSNPIAIGGGVWSAFNTLAGMDKQASVPDEIRGGQGGNYMLTGARKNRFELYNQTITGDYARTIDSYFSMYGYRVNKVKYPNIYGRKSWNYVKAVDMTITGAIPKDDIEKIKQAFARGVTNWHTTDVGNYSLDNSIMNYTKEVEHAQ